MSATRALVAMSGGVDSSVAAAMMVERGYQVTGVTLKLWGGDSDSGCCSVADVEDARRVAAQLSIPHYVFNFADEFTDQVVGPYVAAYGSGRTPNPCVECNRAIKFGRLFERASALGFDVLATGHHALVRKVGERFELLRATDRAKDQSYVLYMLGQRELARVLFPVGELTKDGVRAHAARLGLRTATKPESMDVCFIRKGARLSFLEARVPMRAGRIVGTDGVVLGSHPGIAAFTVGQRRGVGVATGERTYVVDIDAGSGTVTLGSRAELLRDELFLRDLGFVDPATRDGGRDVLVQVRAHGEALAARLTGDVVRFHTPQPRVARGQVVAFYDGDVLLGGGIAA
jgi:tRNA-uridine 2-sulfurtransferase